MVKFQYSYLLAKVESKTQRSRSRIDFLKTDPDPLGGQGHNFSKLWSVNIP